MNGNEHTKMNLAKHGATAARTLLIEIEQVIAAGNAKNGTFNVHEIAQLLTDAVTVTGEFQRGLMIALSDYIGSTLEGCTIDINTWDPLERTMPRLV